MSSFKKFHETEDISDRNSEALVSSTVDYAYSWAEYIRRCLCFLTIE